MSATELKVKRHELKFYISHADYLYAKSVLEKLMTHDKYQKDEAGYFIRSLYFDDLDDTAMFDKLAGVERRAKYRLRIYDFDQDWAKLERKKKYGDIVEKDSGIISRSDAQELIKGNHDVLLKYNNRTLNSIYLDFSKKFYRPVVVVDYVRDVYQLDYNNIRVTFDKMIYRNEYDFDIFNQDLLTEPIQRSDVVILEIKFNDFLPSWFRKLLCFNRSTRSAISKYCMSRLRSDGYYNL